MFFRHLLSVTILPLTMTVLIPWWIGRDAGTSRASFLVCNAGGIREL
jgi:hypothetical protein